MRHQRSLARGILLVAVVFLLLPRAAEAYVDPNLAGSLFQFLYLVLYGGMLFVLAPVLFFWKRISEFVGRRLKRLRSRSDTERSSPPNA